MAVFMLIFAAYAAFMTLMLVEISNQNKAQQRAFVCFDQSGRVTNGIGKECRYVAIRELSQ
jgi:hypothetical protein